MTDKWALIRVITRDNKLSRAELAIGTILIDKFNLEQGYAWPSYETLAELAGVSRRTAIRAVKRLAKLNYFDVEFRQGKGRSNRYRPALPVDETVTCASPNSRQKVTSVTANGDTCDHQTVTTVSPNKKAISLDKSLDKGGAYATAPHATPNGGVGRLEVSEHDTSYVDGEVIDGEPYDAFDEFISIYPKQERTELARPVFWGVIEAGEVAADVLIEAARQYAKSDRPYRYFTAPDAWLRDKRWLDKPKPSEKLNGAKPGRDARILGEFYMGGDAAKYAKELVES